jgi:hypothetical protein
MSDRAITFLTEWVRDNVYDCESDGAEACQEALLRDSHGLGIGLAEFEEAVGDVRAWLTSAMGDPRIRDRRKLGESGATDV